MNTLRSDKGTLIAQLCPAAVKNILSNANGIWTVKKFNNGEKRNCFLFMGDSVLHTSFNKIYIWKDYYIEGGLAG